MQSFDLLLHGLLVPVNHFCDLSMSSFIFLLNSGGDNSGFCRNSTVMSRSCISDSVEYLGPGPLLFFGREGTGCFAMLR